MVEGSAIRADDGAKAEFLGVMNDVAERVWAAGAVEATLAAMYDILDTQQWHVTRSLPHPRTS